MVNSGLPPTWKTWKSQEIKNLFKKSGKSQGIYQENGQVRETSGNWIFLVISIFVFRALVFQENV